MTRKSKEVPSGASTSKLTDEQLRAAIESSDATARKWEAAGNPKLAAEALTRASRNREELRRREGLAQDPPAAEQANAPAAAEQHQPIPIRPEPSPSLVNAMLFYRKVYPASQMHAAIDAGELVIAARRKAGTR